MDGPGRAGHRSCATMDLAQMLEFEASQNIKVYLSHRERARMPEHLTRTQAKEFHIGLAF